MSAQPKIAVLNIPADIWRNMTPQMQLMSMVHQLLEFITTPQFHEMEGLRGQVMDLNNIACRRVVLAIGKVDQAAAPIFTGLQPGVLKN